MLRKWSELNVNYPTREEFRHDLESAREKYRLVLNTRRKLFGDQFKNRSAKFPGKKSTLFYVVSPEISNPGKYRVTHFIKEGSEWNPISHSTYESLLGRDNSVWSHLDELIDYSQLV